MRGLTRRGYTTAEMSTALWLALLALAAGPGAITTDVIPPGQEALVEKMFPVSVPDAPGCERGDIEIKRATIELSVVCPAGTWSITLHHVDVAEGLDGDRVVTERFVVVRDKGADAAMFAEFEKRIRAHEKEFRWTAAARTRSERPSDLPSPGKVEGRKDDPLFPRYREGFALFQDQKHVEAFDHFLKMGREHPEYAGVLGMLVANLAPRMLRGIGSEGMLLAADGADGTVSLLTLDKDVPPGSRIR